MIAKPATLKHGDDFVHTSIEDDDRQTEFQNFADFP
jgi:hypothetical protein